MSARHKQPPDPLGAAPRGESHPLDGSDAPESPAESEFYAAWERRDYGEKSRRGPRKDTPRLRPARPASDLASTRPGNTKRRVPGALKYAQLPGGRHRTVPYAQGAIDSFQPSSTGRPASERAASAAPGSGLFVRPPIQLNDNQTTDEGVNAPQDGAPARRSPSPYRPETTALVHPPAEATGLTPLRDSEDGSLEVRLREALGRLAESEAARMQAELRVRSVEKRVVLQKLSIARPTMLLEDGPAAKSLSWPSQRALWIGIVIAMFGLFGSIAYSQFYVPLQRRLSALQNVHRNSLEQNRRELAALQQLLEQERSRGALEREQLQTRIEELGERRASSPTTPEPHLAANSDSDSESPAKQQPALRPKARRQAHRSRLARAASAKSDYAPPPAEPTNSSPRSESATIDQLQLR